MIACDTLGREQRQRWAVLCFAGCALIWAAWLRRDAVWVVEVRYVVLAGVVAWAILLMCVRKQSAQSRQRGFIRFSQDGTVRWHAASSGEWSAGLPVRLDACRLGETSVGLRLVAEASSAVGRIDLTIPRASLSVDDWVALRRAVRAIERCS